MAEEPRSEEVTACTCETAEERSRGNHEPVHPTVDREAECVFDPPQDCSRDETRNEAAEAHEKVFGGVLVLFSEGGLNHRGPYAWRFCDIIRHNGWLKANH